MRGIWRNSRPKPGVRCWNLHGDDRAEKIVHIEGGVQGNSAASYPLFRILLASDDVEPVSHFQASYGRRLETILSPASSSRHHQGRRRRDGKVSDGSGTLHQRSQKICAVEGRRKGKSVPCHLLDSGSK